MTDVPSARVVLLATTDPLRAELALRSFLTHCQTPAHFDLICTPADDHARSAFAVFSLDYPGLGLHKTPDLPAELRRCVKDQPNVCLVSEWAVAVTDFELPGHGADSAPARQLGVESTLSRGAVLTVHGPTLAGALQDGTGLQGVQSCIRAPTESTAPAFAAFPTTRLRGTTLPAELAVAYFLCGRRIAQDSIPDTCSAGSPLDVVLANVEDHALLPLELALPVAS